MKFVAIDRRIGEAHMICLAQSMEGALSYTIHYGQPGSPHSIRYIKPANVMEMFDRLVASGKVNVTIHTIHSEKLDPEQVRQQLKKISRPHA